MKFHNGFTMVELLITISIMAVLGASIMLSTGSATASAKTVNIINNMRVLKEAATMYYLDHSDSEITQANLNSDTGVKTYLDNSSVLDGTIYSFVVTGSNWYIKYDFTNQTDKDTLASKLASRASSTGLLQNGNDGYSTYTNTSSYVVYMKAR